MPQPLRKSPFGDNLTVDTSGRVRMPNQPSFNGTNATGSTALVDSTWTVIAVNEKRFDNGNNFNTSNYRYTAPVSGVYQVNTSVQIESSSSITWMYLYPIVNGTNTATNGTNFADFTPTGTYWHHSHSCLLSLYANDYVDWRYIKSGGSGTLKGSTENSFSIFLVG